MGVYMDVKKALKAETSLGFTGNWFIDAGILGFVRLGRLMRNERK